MKAEKILFTGKVIDNEDTYILNRIRVFPDTDENIEKILRSQFSDGELERGEFGLDIIDTLKYGKRDPFVFYPLISFSISIIPKIGEMVWVTYSNPKENNGRKEQFYIPTMNSSPFNIVTDSYEQQITNTSKGFNLTLPPKLKSDSIDVNTGRKPYNQPVDGLYALPGDNAIYGQGTTDIILKKDEILLRAGKISDLKPNTINKANEKRGFFQMSYFKTNKKTTEPQKVNTEEIDKTPLKKLIEYNLMNADNVLNAFTGSIYIYDLPPSPNLANDTFTVETQVPNNVTTPVWSYDFIGLSMSGVSSIINDVINALNNGGSELKTKYPDNERFSALYTSILNWGDSRIFPYYYRPSSNIRTLLNTTPDLQNDPTCFIKISNCSNLISRVKASFAIKDFDGNGLISQKNKFGVTTKKITTIKQDGENVLSKNSVSILGSSKIILLSNNSNPIPGKKLVNLKSNTIYGLTQNEIQDDIIPNTDSIVRGEKLKEILNLIVQFLNSHCHAYHGLPPVPVSHSGVSVPQIESEFQLYDSKVLNQNIRIN
jgi:hypothetical protein